MDELKINVSDSVGEVSALAMVPPGAWAGYVLAHGAGAGMRHPFMEDMAGRLAASGVATLRYQFPYMETRRGRPDPPALLERTVRAACAAAKQEFRELPLFAGGKSMGGRMTSQASAADAIAEIRGIVFLGFPLHAPGRPAQSRAEHLARVTVPMLFVQGTRDDLAEIGRMRDVVAGLGARAAMHVVESGDHSFRVLKRSGQDPESVMNGMVDAMVAWMRPLAATEV